MRVFVAEGWGQVVNQAEELAAFYFGRMPMARASRLLSFGFASADPTRADTVTVLRLELPLSGGGTVWFTGSVTSVASASGPGPDHRHQFVGTYLDDDLALSEMVAAAYHCHVRVAALGYGSSFDLDERSRLRARGYVAAVVLRPVLYGGASGGEPPALSVPTTLFSVVPLIGKELDLKLSKGLRALLGAWSRDGKNVLQVRSESDADE